MTAARHLTLLALLTALSLALFVLESALPVPFLAPGAKLGLATIATLVALTLLGPRDALLVLVARVLLASLLFGGPTVFLYSASGGLLSLAAMAALLRLPAPSRAPHRTANSERHAEKAPHAACSALPSRAAHRATNGDRHAGSGPRSSLFSLPAISAAGGFFHHVGQLAVAALMSSTPAIFGYLAVLGPLGLLTGLLTGTLAALLLPRLIRHLPSRPPL